MKKVSLLRRDTARPVSRNGEKKLSRPKTSSGRFSDAKNISGSSHRQSEKPVRTEGSSSYAGGNRSYNSRPSFGSSSIASRGGSRFSNSRGRSFGGSRGRGRKKPMRGEHIDFTKFIYKPVHITQEKKYTAKHTFKDFGLSPEVLKNLIGRGFTHPTAIQDQIIAHAIKGHDVMGLASTGSGKTAAFLLPLIEKVVKDRKHKVLILAPTRELAQQINKELRECSHGMHLFSTVCVGGAPIFRQIQDLRRTNQFVIGTPGRLKDLSKRGAISFGQFGSIVLDEVDRMLDMGFVDDMTLILKALPSDRQALFFSATMPPKIKTLIHTFLKDPKTVDIESGSSTKNVEQDVVRCKTRDEKVEKLLDLLNAKDVAKSIIFVETKIEVDRLTETLRSYNYKVGLLHGDRRQRERERTLSQFRDGILTVLVATDVAARGIDVKDISQVINFTIPQTYDDYIHRIGRTGRAGRKGKAFTFIPA